MLKGNMRMPSKRPRCALAHGCIILWIAACSITPIAADEPQWESLFNGKDLTHWKSDGVHWSVEGGAIVGKTSADQPLKHNIFLIYDGKPLSDFELRLSFQIENGNSGIQYRSKVLDADEFIVGGYQADIDATLRYTGILYEERGRGILAERGQRVTIQADGKKRIEKFAAAEELAKFIHKGKWNQYRIVAKGNHLQHYINGVLMMELTDEQTSKAATEGVLALQLHRGPPMTIRFKDIRCRRFE